MAPIDYGDKVVVYFDVGPSGTEPEFHVANRGKVVSDLRLVDLSRRPRAKIPPWLMFSSSVGNLCLSPRCGRFSTKTPRRRWNPATRRTSHGGERELPTGTSRARDAGPQPDSSRPASAAAILRTAWRLPNGRIDNITKVIEAAGGIVLHVDFGTDDASAAFISTLGDERLWFLVNTQETAGDRVRLSLAHELGHAVLHRYLPVQDEARLEPEAYEFATALMLPSEEFDLNVGPELTLCRARDLKRSYWISIQAIARAARDRQLIDGRRYTSLCKQVSARGWRREEPDPLPVERPGVWPNALAVHRHRHGYDDDDLLRLPGST
jgi:Zn-dependent peptidase ImmA (M78 family)